MRRTLKHKRHNYEITEILKKRNFEVDAERDNANRGVSVSIKVTLSFLIEKTT